MNYCGLKTASLVDGLGVRVALFVSGCHHHCKGCFNWKTWDPDYGESFTKEVATQIITLMKKPYITGFTLLGGEPFFGNNPATLKTLLKQIKQEFPEKDIWCFTGGLLENYLPDGIEYSEDRYEMLQYIDVLVDGPFIEDQKDLTIPFRGSSNQEILDVKESLKQNKRIPYKLN